jgi:hypothetical protein
MIQILLLPAYTFSQASGTTSTFYFSDGTSHQGCIPAPNFNDGNRYGPCNNYDGQAGVPYGPQSRYWAAIANCAGKYNEILISEHCGKAITLTHESGRSIQLQVMYI